MFTLVFVGSALFLLAGRAVLGDAARRLTRFGAWLAPLLLAMHARYYIDFTGAAETVMRAVPLAGGAVLLLLARMKTAELSGIADPPTASSVAALIVVFPW